MISTDVKHVAWSNPLVDPDCCHLPIASQWSLIACSTPRMHACRITYCCHVGCMLWTTLIDALLL